MEPMSGGAWPTWLKKVGSSYIRIGTHFLARHEKNRCETLSLFSCTDLYEEPKKTGREEKFFFTGTANADTIDHIATVKRNKGRK